MLKKIKVKLSRWTGFQFGLCWLFPTKELSAGEDLIESRALPNMLLLGLEGPDQVRREIMKRRHLNSLLWFEVVR